MAESKKPSASLHQNLPVLSKYEDLPLEATHHELALVWLTPELAKQLMMHNTPDRQRRMRPDHVEKAVRHIRAGTWSEVYDPYRFSWPEVEGERESALLLDGQHRLQAVIITGHAYETLMLFGCDPAEQAHMDQGAKRTFADLLRFHGYSNALNLSAVAHRVYAYVQTSAMINTRTSLRMYPTPSPDDLLEFVRQHSARLYEAISISSSVQRHVGGVSKSVLAAMAWVFLRVDRQDAEAFFDRLGTGEQLSAEDPIHVLRQRLLNATMRKEHLTADESAALLVKAWNAYRKGNRVRVLAWKPGGANPERFPEPV